MKQHPLTQAIEIFEQEAMEVKLAYSSSLAASGGNLLQTILERDEGMERCLWAIEILQDAYKRQTAFNTVLPLQAVAI